MNNRRQFCCGRPTMNGFRFVFMTLSLLWITIMLFIWSTLNYDFVRKNHQKRTRSKSLFKLCFLLIGSYNINIGPGIINTMLTSFMIYSRLRSMMSLLLRIITNIVLGLLLSLRFITMRRSLTFLRIVRHEGMERLGLWCPTMSGGYRQCMGPPVMQRRMNSPSSYVA
jgi:hypothetical protein